MELLVKVIGKEIKSGTKSFNTYSLLTSEGNWYRTAKIDVDELNDHDGEIMKAIVTRKFDKEYTKADGTVGKFPCLVVEKLVMPTNEELAKFEEKLNKKNAETLKDVR